MHIPAWVPRLPPGLISAWALEYATYRYMRRQKKRESRRRNRAANKKKRTIVGRIGKGFFETPIQLVLPEAEARPKYDCKICISSGKRRAIIELMPGRTTKHNPAHGRQLQRAILSHRHGTGGLPFREYRTWRYIVALIRYVGEKGLIHDFTESTDNTNRYGWFAFRYRLCVPPGIYPFAELRLSNFITGDIYLCLPGDGLPIEPALKLQLEAQMTWGKEIFIERPKGLPGVVRIATVGQYVPKDIPRKVNGVANTKFHFGTTILTDKTEPITIGIHEMATNFHLYGIGQISSGKTNLWKQLLQDAHDMIDNGIVSKGWFFDPSEKKAAGLRHLESKLLPFAVTPERTVELMRDIRSEIKFRNDRMEEINAWLDKQGKPQISEWPVGQTITLPGGKPELYTVKLILSDEFNSFSKDLIENVWLTWAKTIRSLGFVMVLLGQDFRVNTGIPAAFFRCFDARICLRVRDSDVRGDFFKVSKEFTFARDPTRLKQGEFVLDLPARSLDLIYGRTKHIPNESVQAA